jgi:hypothetical protein
VRLHAFTFASNHFHLLVWARGAALAGFMQYLRANLSKKVGKLMDWSGKELREQYRAFVAAFREAAARWRWEDFSVRFPLFSFPPRVVPRGVARVL